MNIPMSSPDLIEAEIAAVNRVLNTPVLSLGLHAHIAPGVHLGGEVTVGQGALVGIGATVMPRRAGDCAPPLSAHS